MLAQATDPKIPEIRSLFPASSHQPDDLAANI
jgi:hypothetical protein